MNHLALLDIYFDRDYKGFAFLHFDTDSADTSFLAFAMNQRLYDGKMRWRLDMLDIFWLEPLFFQLRMWWRGREIDHKD